MQPNMQYLYHIAINSRRGAGDKRMVAVLTKFKNGEDVDTPIKKIGLFDTQAEAKAACLAHHAKAQKMAIAASRPVPTILWG